MRTDQIQTLTPGLRLSHEQVMEQLVVLLNEPDPPFNPDDIPIPLIAARARHNARK